MYSHYIDDFLKTYEDTRKELSLENLTHSLKEFNNKKKRFSDDFIKNIQHSAELISLFYLQKAILQHEKNPLFFDACYDVWAESVLLLQKIKQSSRYRIFIDHWGSYEKNRRNTENLVNKKKEAFRETLGLTANMINHLAKGKNLMSNFDAVTTSIENLSKLIDSTRSKRNIWGLSGAITVLCGIAVAIGFAIIAFPSIAPLCIALIGGGFLVTVGMLMLKDAYDLHCERKEEKKRVNKLENALRSVNAFFSKPPLKLATEEQASGRQSINFQKKLP